MMMMMMIVDIFCVFLFLIMRPASSYLSVNILCYRGQQRDNTRLPDTRGFRFYKWKSPSVHLSRSREMIKTRFQVFWGWQSFPVDSWYMGWEVVYPMQLIGFIVISYYNHSDSANVSTLKLLRMPSLNGQTINLAKYCFFSSWSENSWVKHCTPPKQRTWNYGKQKNTSVGKGDIYGNPSFFGGFHSQMQHGTGMFASTYHKFKPNVDKYCSPMKHLGLFVSGVSTSNLFCRMPRQLWQHPGPAPSNSTLGFVSSL